MLLLQSLRNRFHILQVREQGRQWVDQMKDNPWCIKLGQWVGQCRPLTDDRDLQSAGNELPAKALGPLSRSEDLCCFKNLKEFSKVLDAVVGVLRKH